MLILVVNVKIGSIAGSEFDPLAGSFDQNHGSVYLTQKNIY